MYRKIFKPCFDYVFALGAVLVSAPLMLMISLVLLAVNRGQILFIQERPGYREKPFRVYKFRTMKELRNEQGELLPDKERITSFGKFLRRTSLDELPQLFNILKGELSLVGPRPLLMEYLPLYSPEQALRHEVLPGITGLAQVSGRNLLSWEEKFQLDVYYVKNISFLLDLKIILKTFVILLKGKGVDMASGEFPEKMKKMVNGN